LATGAPKNRETIGVVADGTRRDATAPFSIWAGEKNGVAGRVKQLVRIPWLDLHTLNPEIRAAALHEPGIVRIVSHKEIGNARVRKANKPKHQQRDQGGNEWPATDSR